MVRTSYGVGRASSQAKNAMTQAVQDQPRQDQRHAIGQTAALYRMVFTDHTCPYGLKARALLQRKGFTVEDHPLRTRAETEAFKAEHGVATTPQIFIDGRRIGGYDDLRRHLGLKVAAPGATSYRPVIAVFAMTALIAAAIS